jgi:hypothetical protein
MVGDRWCIEGDGLETHMKSFNSSNLSYVIGDPVKKDAETS